MPSSPHKFKNYDDHYVIAAEAAKTHLIALDAARLKYPEIGSATIVQDIRHKKIMEDIASVMGEAFILTSTEEITLYRERASELHVLAELAVHQTESDFPFEAFGIRDQA